LKVRRDHKVFPAREEKMEIPVCKEQPVLPEFKVPREFKAQLAHKVQPELKI